METELEAKTKETAGRLASLGRRLEASDESDLLVWVIPNQLACAHRPLRHHRLYGGSGRNLAREATALVIEWAEMVQLLEIKSIICLMHQKELGFYAALDLGAADLVDFYRLRGFDVRHLPWEDPLHTSAAGGLALLAPRLLSVCVEIAI